MYFLPFSCRFYHKVDQLCLFGHDWIYQNRRKNSRQWGYLIFNVTLVDTFFLLWSTRSVFCRMTVGLLSAKRPLTAFVCWHFSPAITPKLLIVERKARLDSKEEIKRSQCTKFKMCQLFLALLKALFVWVCVCVSRLLLEVCINYSEYTKDSTFLRGNVSTCCGYRASPVLCRVSLMKDDPAVTDPERTRSNYRTKATYFSHLHG